MRKRERPRPPENPICDCQKAVSATPGKPHLGPLESLIWGSRVALSGPPGSHICDCREASSGITGKPHLGLPGTASGPASMLRPASGQIVPGACCNSQDLTRHFSDLHSPLLNFSHTTSQSFTLHFSISHTPLRRFSLSAFQILTLHVPDSRAPLSNCPAFSLFHMLTFP